MNWISLVHMLAVLLLAPLLVGVIHRTKAFFAGRVGQPLLQLYYDLWKLLRKGAVYSRTTSFVFRIGPLVGGAAVFAALALMPFGNSPALLAFDGDLILFAYLLGLMRFFTVISALDTGSSFEGMGASREVQVATLAEPALFLALAVVVKETGNLSLSAIFPAISVETWAHAGPALALVAVAIVVVFLAENARIPVDDPNTHLELTMIHEVMVLDHSGPDFALILYSATLKLWVLGALLMGIVLPVRTGNLWLDGAAFVVGMMGLAFVTGVIESSMARLRLVRVPQLLIGAGVLAVAALALVFR